MVFRTRAGVLALAFVGVVVLGLGAGGMAAQEPSAGKPAEAAGTTAPAAPKASDPSRRVPRFFGQIGLTPEQKDEIYKIRGKHQQKLEELQKQIARVQSEMMAECEAVLNETQKKMLTYRREASAKARKARASSTETPAPAKPSEKSAN